MFGERLRELRKKESLTMKELGRKLNLAESTISGYENGNRKPDYDTLNQFANFFEVSTDYLLGRSNYKRISENKNTDDIVNDPELGLWFKDIQNASRDNREELRQFWEFIKQKDMNRKLKDNQK